MCSSVLLLQPWKVRRYVLPPTASNSTFSSSVSARALAGNAQRPLQPLEVPPSTAAPRPAPSSFAGSPAGASPAASARCGHTAPPPPRWPTRARQLLLPLLLHHRLLALLHQRLEQPEALAVVRRRSRSRPPCRCTRRASRPAPLSSDISTRHLSGALLHQPHAVHAVGADVGLADALLRRTPGAPAADSGQSEGAAHGAPPGCSRSLRRRHLLGVLEHLVDVARHVEGLPRAGRRACRRRSP